MLSHIVKVCVTIIFILISQTSFAVVWDGPEITFVKPADSLEADHLTQTVAITRDVERGIFNILRESSFTRRSSPIGTSWAFAGLNGNPSDNTFNAANHENLNFTNWEDSLITGQVGLNILNRAGVLHLIDEDIYLDITFIEWVNAIDGTAGGAFTYIRRTPSVIAEPAPVSVPIPIWVYAVLFLLLGFIAAKSVMQIKLLDKK